VRLNPAMDRDPDARPLGTPIEWEPPRRPARQRLEGQFVVLEPLDSAAHGAALFEASHGSAAAAGLWDYMSVGPFASEADFAAWAEASAVSDDPLFLTIVDRDSGKPSGVCSYLRITPEHGVIEIGNIWFSPDLQRTRQGTEAIFVLARHVFDELGYRRLEWKCDSLNAPSRRAAERLGFTFEGVFRQHMVVKSRNRDTAWYALVDRDWTLVKRAFSEWLSADNHDELGRQLRSLGAIRASIVHAVDEN
jgi:RimJ/RimL family protein N-acetyltransferase